MNRTVINMKKFAVVVAVDEEMGIGRAGGLPWRLARDMQRFREITLSSAVPGCRNVVIMGRKTWDSLPGKFRPLPDRLNIVITSQADLALPEGVVRSSSLDQALNIAGEKTLVGDVFVIGGAKVFAEAILHRDCERLYVTHISGTFSCDVFFPRIPPFFKILEESAVQVENSQSFRFCDYSRP